MGYHYSFENRGMRDIDQRCFAIQPKIISRFFQEEHIEVLSKKRIDLTKHFKFSLISSPLFFFGIF